MGPVEDGEIDHHLADRQLQACMLLHFLHASVLALHTPEGIDHQGMNQDPASSSGCHMVGNLHQDVEQTQR
jgi:hypothetical protein